MTTSSVNTVQDASKTDHTMVITIPAIEGAVQNCFMRNCADKEQVSASDTVWMIYHESVRGWMALVLQ